MIISHYLSRLCVSWTLPLEQTRCYKLQNESRSLLIGNKALELGKISLSAIAYESSAFPKECCNCEALFLPSSRL